MDVCGKMSLKGNESLRYRENQIYRQWGRTTQKHTASGHGWRWYRGIKCVKQSEQFMIDNVWIWLQDNVILQCFAILEALRCHISYHTTEQREACQSYLFQYSI